MGNLSDKIIDDQGNARTYSSGYDSRLHYVDINGQDKKYLLEGEGGGTPTPIPSSLTFGPATIFSEDGKFHIKFNCDSINDDDYLDLCFYINESYDGTKEATCDLSYKKTEHPEEEEPYHITKYIFRGAYNSVGDSTYFQTENFDNGGDEGSGEPEDVPEDGPGGEEENIE